VDIARASPKFSIQQGVLPRMRTEPSMYPCDEVHGGWRRQPALDIHPVDLSLDSHMRHRLQGERSGGFLQLRAGECVLDIPWPGIVTFDQVRIVAVHDPYEVCKFKS